MTATHEDPAELLLPDDPLWFKDAIIYEVHVRAFHDSNGDGVGDFQGLIEKLDYLKDLGITALWVLPFFPSPGRDDGYDIADYTRVKESYGTMRDFRRLLREAHARGLRVIIELVINHTSAEHEWFQRARRAPAGSKARNFYVWSDSPERYQDARIIFQDFETSNWTWDPVAHAYYWHRFYSHQPDLNFDNVEVHKAVLRVLDFWMRMGVDGLRLDAIPYLYERDGTNCENLPETHAFLKKLRAHIDAHYPNRMILAEANQWPEDAAQYFGDGDECHMNFHFPLMPRMFMAVQMESNFPIIDILNQTPTIPPTCQWALFLRNHDELTLEMVTDEDRDYMYRVYAEDRQARVNLGIRRRLAPLLKERNLIELMNGLLFSLPGTPVLYYGDEIGMGDNIYLGDRDAVRTPMQWSADRNAGFSKANPQRLFLPVIIDPEYHYESINVEAQAANPASDLWWMKRIISLRKDHPVFGRGELELLHPENGKVLAYLRKDERETILVVANLSRFAQYVELDLRRYDGMVPVELFGHTRFPAIGELPYLLTLGPHAFYWFSIESPESLGLPAGHEAPTELEASGSWESLLSGRKRATLERIIARHLPHRRWFRSKSRRISQVRIVDDFPWELEEGVVHALVLEVKSVEEDLGRYVLPIAFSTGEAADNLCARMPEVVLARVTEVPEDGGAAREGVLYDALVTADFPRALLETVAGRRERKGRVGLVKTDLAKRFRQTMKGVGALEPRLLSGEQTNTTVFFGQKLVMKVFRRLDEGLNPEVEIGRFLTERAGFDAAPATVGELIYETSGRPDAAFGVVQELVPNQGEAWTFTLDAFERALERTLSFEKTQPSPAPTDVVERSRRPLPEEIAEIIGPSYSLLDRLGVRVAELHLALASEPEDPAFAPEPFTTLQQRSVYQAARTMMGKTFLALRQRRAALSEPVGAEVDALLAAEGAIDERLRGILGEKIEAVRIRCHGDLHLGQVLHTGDDFVIIDFEGEPSRPLGERRIKRSPLRDVAGILRSYDYAANAVLLQGRVRRADVERLNPWALALADWSAAAFLRGYLGRAGDATFIPRDPRHLEQLLDFYVIEKCIYEVGYELDHRPDWITTPVRGLLRILEDHT